MPDQTVKRLAADICESIQPEWVASICYNHG